MEEEVKPVEEAPVEETPEVAPESEVTASEDVGQVSSDTVTGTE